MTSENLPTQAMASFDVATEPWLPCETLEGERVELGLREVLLRAHELRALHDESPLVTLMAHRILLGIVERITAPTNQKEWLAIYRAQRLPEEPIQAYFERWKHRFDLFDASRPFLQVASLEKTLLQERGKEAERGLLVRMVMETSTHSSQALLFARMPEDARLSPAAAARGLIAFLGYAQGGRIQNETESWKTGTLRGAASALVMGKTLKETLVLNTLIHPTRNALDCLVWERENDIQKGVRSFTGPLDQWVFPVRRVQLFPEWHDGRLFVREVITGAGERNNDFVQDPQHAFFVRDPKQPPVALRFDPDRGAWRDCTALFDAMGADGCQRPAALAQLDSLIVAGHLARHVALQVALYGMATDQAVILLWRAERLPLPATLLVDRERVAILRCALELAEKVAEDLDYRVLFVLCERVLAPTDRDAHKNDIRALKNALGAMPLYWAELGRQFPAWLVRLGESEEPEETLVDWRVAIRVSAWRALRMAADHVGLQADALAANAQSERKLAEILKRHLGAAPSRTPQEPTSPGAST